MIYLRFPRLWALVVAPLVAFGLMAYATEDRAFILALNIVQAAAASAVVVAFLPEIGRIIFGREPMRRDAWLVYGVWVSWCDVLYRTIESLVWRILGQPSWIINSDFTSAYLWFGIIAAISHIIRPGGLNDRVPAREWIRVGVIIGSAVLVALGVIYADDIKAAWFGHQG